MPDLLFEIGTEELPASAVYDAVEQLERMVPELLQGERLAFEESWVLASPRRLSVSVRGLTELTQARVTEIKGPPLSAARDDDGTWTSAAIGFARSRNVSLGDLIIKDTDKGAKRIRT